MANTAPIGIFDSGLGGLTIVQQVMRQLPHERILYFGDTAHLPYGDKSPAQLRQYARDITRFLIDQGVKAIAVACNTATAVALDVVKETAGTLPVYEVIGPAVRQALAHSPHKIIGVIGTRTTVGSGAYTRSIQALDANAQVISLATPLLVPLIEEGWKDTPVMQMVLATYLTPKHFSAVDSLVLGCTHYPLVEHLIQAHLDATFPQPVQVINSASAVAAEMKADLELRGLLNPDIQPPAHTFFVSDLTPGFQAHASLFLQQDVRLQLQKLS